MNDTYTTSKKGLKPTTQVIYWSVAWGVSILLACIGTKFLHLSNMLFIAVLIVNIGIGIGAIRAHIIWLNAIDEMQRKIQLESMALTLGILWVVWGALLILDAANIFRADIVIFPVLAALAMSAGTIFGVFRHR